MIKIENLKKNLIELWDAFLNHPVVFAVIIFAIVLIINVILTISFYRYDKEFFKNLLIESHSLLFDIIIFGIILFYITEMSSKKKEILRYHEEIDDFRTWNSDEAKHRIVGNVKRLNSKDITEINLQFCKLKKTDFSYTNLSKAEFFNTDLEEAIFYNTNLESANIVASYLKNAILVNANLKQTNFWFSNLNGCDFFCAILDGADFSEAILSDSQNLTIEQLSRVKSLHKAVIDEELKKVLKEKYPNLFIDSYARFINK